MAVSVSSVPSRYDPPDDCAWYRFDAQHPAPTRFHWRAVGGVEDSGRVTRAQLVLL